MKKIALKPLPLALACLLASAPLAQVHAAAGLNGHHPGNRIDLNTDLVQPNCRSAYAFNPTCVPAMTLARRSGTMANSYRIEGPTRRAWQTSPLAFTLPAARAGASRAGAYQINLDHRPAPHIPTRLFTTSASAPEQIAASAAGNPASMSIPLDLIRTNYSNGQYSFRLGINVGVNGGAPREYLFDTGSDTFNIAVGTNPAPEWFPATGAAQSSAYPYLYGDGSYGYWQKDTTVGSIQFYNTGTGQQVGTYDTSGGMPVAIATDWIVTQNNYYFGGDTLGNPVVTINGIGTLYQDLTWQQTLDAGQAPEEGIFYGTFGAGDFGTGVPGMLTKTGYIVEANGTGAVPGQCQEACLIMGLTPALRAQFLSVVPWFGLPGRTFPLTGQYSAYQFDTAFWYTLTDGSDSQSVGLVTLFDTGTPNVVIIDDGSLGLTAHEQAAGNINPYGDVVPGLTLTAQGLSVTNQGLFLVGQPDTMITGSDTSGDYSDVVTLGPYGGFGPSVIYGIGFFMRNAVMYDIENQATGFTPFFVTDVNVSSSLRVTKASGPLGLAGTISGASDFQVVDGGIANLSGTNTYTGATIIGSGSWVGLAGPGTIESTSSVDADGIFDISRAWQATNVGSLSGNGTVELGGGVLNLTAAHGSFGGSITDGGLGGGNGGRVLISAGQETFGGANTYTGLTGIAAPATLTLNGSLAGDVASLGLLVNNGSIAGSVASDGAITGNGSIAGDLTVNGAISAGGTPGKAYTLTVGGNYQQAANTGYTVQFDPSNAVNASRINVAGSATLGANVSLSLMPSGQGVFHIGQQYTVFDATQGLTGQFNLTGNTQISAVLGVTLSADANHAYLNVIQSRLLTAVSGSGNQVATLAGIQGLPTSSPVFAAVTSLSSDNAIRAAATQLSGAVHASVRGAMLQDSVYLRDAVNGRLHQAATGNTGPNMHIDQGGLNWWTQVVGATGYRDGSGELARQTHDTKGVFVGADYALGSSGRLGMSIGATNTSLRTKERISNANSDNLSLSLYGGVQLGGFGLRGGLAHTRHQIDSSRLLLVPGLKERLLGNYQLNTEQAFADGSYRFNFGSTSVEPFLRGAWIHLDGDTFRERGVSDSAAALHNQGDSQSITQGSFGIRVATDFALGNSSLTLHEMLGRQHVFSDLETTSTEAFAGGSSYQVYGLPLVENATTVGLGLSWNASKSFSLDLSFQGRFASGAPDKAGHLRLNWWF